MIITKEYPYKIGKQYNKKYFNIIINNDQKVYLHDKNHLLFSFHKNIVDNEKYFPLLEKYYNTPILTSRNRKTATGKKLGTNETTPSGILGFIDTIPQQYKKKLNGLSKAARKTKFLIEKEKGWKETISLYQDVDKIFKKSEPKYYKIQKKEYHKIHYDLKIPRTNFTTITVNRNWRTATHTDQGDLQNGLSCILCIGNRDYTGGYLGFPKQKILVKMEPGDIIFMDSHQPHCNTELKLGKKGVRYSLVCYIRENMKHFNYPIHIDDLTFFLTKDDFIKYNKKH